MDESQRLLQRTLDGEHVDQHGQRLRAAALDHDPERAASWERVEALDRRLGLTLTRLPPERMHALFERVRSAIPQRAPVAHAAIPAAWIAAGIAAGCLALLVPLLQTTVSSSVGLTAWMALASALGILLVLAASVPLRAGHPLLLLLLHSRIPLGPMDRVACLCSGICLLVAALYVTR